MQKRKTARIAAALIAVLLLTFILSAVPGLAADAGKPVSLTVDIGEEGAAQGMPRDSVAVDLYYVGQPVNGEGDKTVLRAVAPFESLDLSAGKDRDAMRRLTDEAMEIAVRDGSPVVTGASPGKRITAGDDGKPLAAGMYLVVPHGKGMDSEDYLLRISDDTGEIHVLTSAKLSSSVFLFQPQLLAVPILAGEAELYDCDITVSGEEHIYDARISFKYEEPPQEGSLTITKTLLSHKQGDSPTFLFTVDARKGGRLVFSNVYSLRFDAAGEKSLTVDGLPAGAEVTVTEVYSGAGYKLVSSAVQTTMIVADAASEVRFVNEHENPELEGGSLVNRFAYSEDQGWSWQQLPAAEG